MKRCQRKADGDPIEVAARVIVSEGQWVFREKKVVPVWETWCGESVPVSSSMTIGEGDPLPGVECEDCRKAKAAADVEKPSES